MIKCRYDFFRLFVIGFIFIFIIISCEPERDNPYDPKSPHLNYSQITGRVMTKVGNPIQNAQIALIFKSATKMISTQSDSNGNYNIEYYYVLEQGDSVSLNAIKSSYADKQEVISISYKKKDTVNFILDALPQFITESIISLHEQLLFPGDIFSVIFSTRIIDIDGSGDIDSVFVVVPSLAKTFALDYYPGSIYRKTVPAESFPEASLEWLIGADCYFEVLSKMYLRTRSAPVQLNRVIYETLVQIEPFEDTVNNTFTCIWHSLQLSYPFSYGVEIYSLNGVIPQLVYSSPTIIDTFINITIVPVASLRQYYWQALIRDNYGNISKSNQILFYIRN